MIRWLIIWGLSVLAFYLIGYFAGYIESLSELIRNTSPIDHIIPVVAGVIVGSIGWGCAKLAERHSKNLNCFWFVVIALAISVGIEVPMYLIGVQIVTVT